MWRPRCDFLPGPLRGETRGIDLTGQDDYDAGVSASGGHVDYCENSTITEAWTVILGLPGAVDPTDPPVLERSARRRLDSLERKPAVVAVDVRGDAVPPFWNQQVTWGQGRHLARFGHRYLSVHFIRRDEDRYTRFSDVLAPPTKTWLDVYAESLGGEHPIDRVGFGYVNRFTFSAADFDLSKYFSINVGVDVGSQEAGLLGLTTAFRFYDPSKTMYLTVELSAESVPTEDGEIGVTTKVFAERRGLEALAFADPDAVLEQVATTKEAAKEAFFSLATEATHSIMGVVHASDGP